jgi:hypothetical protein
VENILQKSIVSDDTVESSEPVDLSVYCESQQFSPSKIKQMINCSRAYQNDNITQKAEQSRQNMQLSPNNGLARNVIDHDII